MRNNRSYIFILWSLIISTNNLRGQEITFSEHIAPVIFKNCTPCHRPHQIAPMPFTNYEEVSTYASMIRYVTGIKYMPPWKATNNNHSFESARGLNEEEIALIRRWIDAGALEGDSTLLPPLPPKPITPQLQNPDMVFSMSESFEQYGVYYDQFKVFVLPFDIEEDKAISEIEFVPGNASIVRSCFISVAGSENLQTLDDWDPSYGYFSFGEIGMVPLESRWYTWTPLQSKWTLKGNEAKRLPKKGNLLFHIHYGPTGVALRDSSSLRIKYYDKKTPPRIIQNVPLIHRHNLTNPPFEIPANKKVRFHAKYEVPFDMELKGLMPHSHLLGNTWEIFVVETDSKQQADVLLKIEDWDFKWKSSFRFSKPIQLKKGSTIHAIAQYDNSPDNLSNPSDPPRDMGWGKRMFEEMFLVYFEVIPSLDSSEVQLLFNSSTLAGSSFLFRFSLDESKKLSAELSGFDDKFTYCLFDRKVFEKGKQSIRVHLEGLPYGNYYLELKNERDEVVARHLFVYLKETEFE